MLEAYSKQKNSSIQLRKQTPTLKIKNITFCRQYTKNIDQEMLNFHLKMGRNMSHKYLDFKTKNKQNCIENVCTNQNSDKKSTIADIFSIKSMNLANSMKLYFPMKTYNQQNNSQINQIMKNCYNNRSMSKLKRNSQNYESLKAKKSKTAINQSRRQSSTSPINRKSRTQTQKPTELMLTRQRKLLLNTNDKVFEIKFMNYCNFLQEVGQLHKVKVEFEDYDKCKVVMVGKGNNSKLVKDTLKKRWWLRVQEKKSAQSFDFSTFDFLWTQIKVNDYYRSNISIGGKSLHNHFQFNGNLGNKKQLFINMKKYFEKQNKNPFEVLPLTYHVKNLQDKQFLQFKKQYEADRLANPQKKQLWIVKPGQNSNRGRGITIHSDIQQIQKLLAQQSAETMKISQNLSIQAHTFIIQKYIQHPFLYNRRKFDIRCYYLLVSINNKIKAYWYKQGYIRTSCFEYSTNQESKDNLFVHLTNDAVQKYNENYGKFEDGNKIDFNSFKKYLASKYPSKKYNFDEQIYENIKIIALDSIKATYNKLKNSTSNPVFQIFGLDFMIDEDFKPWLIQVNTNPCLETSCMVLQRIIPRMLDDAFQLSLDVMFPPPKNWPSSRKHLIPNQQHMGFELFFDEEEWQKVSKIS